MPSRAGGGGRVVSRADVEGERPREPPDLFVFVVKQFSGVDFAVANVEAK